MSYRPLFMQLRRYHFNFRTKTRLGVDIVSPILVSARDDLPTTFLAAAHAMHPGPGEGARQAFEDAHQLCLALVDAGARALEPAAVRRALKRYELLRKHRCETVQAVALEGSGLPREETVPPEYRNFTLEQRYDRFNELARWLRSYPDNPFGDPDSRFFKPPAGLQRLVQELV
eukprot:TRINITY_DN4922_c0_g1_i3.p1 TRINITY_DN4922_c0_g1~~TRINITY_DN4922_c0_g1_i3.p1  ORF type:complete len:173 (+),score=18.10 TRINITY_DN4922_c0_g1_i3:371-889(+)